MGTRPRIDARGQIEGRDGRPLGCHPAPRYGLAGGVYSASEERAKAIARRIRAGQVEINGAAFNPLAPYGGYKRSGHGRELGPYGIEEFLTLKAIQL